MSEVRGASDPLRRRVPDSGRVSYWPVPVVLVVGLAVSVVIAIVSHTVYTHNENRLLTLRAKEAETVLTAALPSIQTPLASAAALADATHGNAKQFRTFIAPYVGTRTGQPFVSVSLWRLGDVAAGPVTVLGSQPELVPSQAQSFFATASHSPQIGVMPLLHAARPRIGYAYNTPGKYRYVAYGESALAVNRQQRVQSNSAFSDLDFAIYLGRTTRPAGLLISTVKRLPLPGHHATEVVPFGDSALTLVVAARRSLSGSLPQRLPLILGLTGGLLTLLAALLSWRLSARRVAAEHLAGQLEQIAAENRDLYAQQRDIAQTLQHALLPESLPKIEGLETAARYVAGEIGMEIGGDWYDVIPVGERCVLVAVGDVSGRGLRAAATMASLRFAIQAYAVQEDSPSVILSKLSRLLSVMETGQLATVLCAAIDLDSHEVTIASAGHLPPLLVTNGRGEFLGAKVGVPVGVEHDATYPSTQVSVTKGATLLAFTDGLVERKHESIDQGLARLRTAAAGNGTPLPQLLDRVLDELHNPPAQDDTAIVGLRWTT